MSLTRYVVGFLFNETGYSVVLIRKTKPRWQAGLLNGVGGKVEHGETPIQAMLREFREETGVQTEASIWRHFCDMACDAFEVACFVARNQDAWATARTMEREGIEKVSPAEMKSLGCVSNLPWLVELALDDNGGREFFSTVRYSPPFRSERHGRRPSANEAMG